MPEWMTHLLHLFSLSAVGLPAIFLVALVSATLLPMATEPVLFGFVQLNPHLFWPAIGVATVGNTLGGMLTYYMGYGAHELIAKKQHTPHFNWMRRVGAPILLLSWLPIIGDALCAMSGWLQLPWRAVLFWMALGKCLRFILMTSVLLWIPDAFWQRLF